MRPRYRPFSPNSLSKKSGSDNTLFPESEAFTQDTPAMDEATAQLVLEYLSNRPVPPISQAPIVLQDLISSARIVNIIYIVAMMALCLSMWVGAYVSGKAASAVLRKKDICAVEYRRLPYDLKQDYISHHQGKWILVVLSFVPFFLTTPAFVNLSQIEMTPHRWLYEEAEGYYSWHGQRINSRILLSPEPAGVADSEDNEVSEIEESVQPEPEE
jgi:hypothetical protein